ncbi:hypothetical protein LCGC14_0624030 [marine sediment metagenome]|uniref:Uncharacterized protein n=1 Tax=marine sediment metagenome TaxID=412755 RepID=A0A0F9R423_9ZZZZ
MSEEIKNDDTNTDDTNTDNPNIDDTNDGMTDGVPTAVSKAIDTVNDQNKDDTDYTDLDDDNKDDDNKDDAKDDDNTKDSTDDSTDNDTGDTGDDADEDEGIIALGYDAETVQKLNDLDPNIVKDIKALLERGISEKSSEDDDPETPKKKIEKVETTGQVTDEQLEALEKENPAMAAIVKSLNSQVGKLSTALNSVTEDEKVRAEKAEKEEHYSNFCDMNKVLDGLEKDFPIFGTYDKLPMNVDGVPDDRHRSVRERADLWGKANALYSTGAFGSFKESLESVITLYRGENGENLAMRKVAKELRGRSKQITTRPNRTKTKTKTPKEGSDAFMEKVVGDALAEAGVKD